MCSSSQQEMQKKITTKFRSKQNKIRIHADRHTANSKHQNRWLEICALHRKIVRGEQGKVPVDENAKLTHTSLGELLEFMGL